MSHTHYSELAGRYAGLIESIPAYITFDKAFDEFSIEERLAFAEAIRKFIDVKLKELPKVTK